MSQAASPIPDLTMPHLTNAKADVERAMASQHKASERRSAQDPRLQRNYTFDLNYTDDRGNVWQGRFTNRVLNIAQRMKVGIVRGKRQVGVPLEALMATTIELIYVVSWLEESLTESPDWAKNLLDLTDESIILAIFEEVSLHENTFHGRRPPAQASAGKPGDGGEVDGAVVHAEIPAPSQS